MKGAAARADVFLFDASASNLQPPYGEHARVAFSRHMANKQKEASMFRSLTVAVAAVLLSTAALAEDAGGKVAKAVMLFISGDTTLVIGKYESWNNCRDAMDVVNAKAVKGGELKDFEAIVVCVKVDF
jgi:hypothetical protein